VNRGFWVQPSRHPQFRRAARPAGLVHGKLRPSTHWSARRVTWARDKTFPAGAVTLSQNPSVKRA